MQCGNKASVVVERVVELIMWVYIFPYDNIGT